MHTHHQKRSLFCYVALLSSGPVESSLAPSHMRETDEGHRPTGVDMKCWSNKMNFFAHYLCTSAPSCRQVTCKSRQLACARRHLDAAASSSAQPNLLRPRGLVLNC